MISGETRLIAESSASGMWISAVVNRTIASAVERGAAEHDRAECRAQREDMAEADQERADHAGRDQPAHRDDLAERIALRGQFQDHVVDGECRHRAYECEHAAAVGAR